MFLLDKLIENFSPEFFNQEVKLKILFMFLRDKLIENFSLDFFNQEIFNQEVKLKIIIYVFT